MKDHLKKIVANPFFSFLANHGAEVDYFVGTGFNTLTSGINNNALALNLSADALTGITIGWNYFDALYDFMLALTQILDDRKYRQSLNKIQATLNIISGIQLATLSYNPPLTDALGLSSPTDLASSSFAFSALFDLIVAAIEFYNANKERAFNGWLNERIKELVFTIRKNYEAEHLIENIRTRAKVYVAGDLARKDTIHQVLSHHLGAEDGVMVALKEGIEQLTAKHRIQNEMMQKELDQAYKESRTNLLLKTASFIAMTLLAINHFQDKTTDSADRTLIWGLGLSTFVAAAYLTYNIDRLMDTVGNYSHRFFAAAPSRANLAGPVAIIEQPMQAM